MRLIRKSIPLFENIYFFFISVFLKILYDYLILTCLPSNYMIGVSYGINFNLFKYSIGWIIYIFFLYSLVITFSDTFINYVVVVCFFMCFLPAVSSFGLNDADGMYILFQTIYWSLLFIFLIGLKKIKYKNIFSKKISKGKFFFYIIFSLFAIIIILFCYKYNHFKISFNLADVYDIRAAAVGNIPIYISWIKTSFGTITIPFLIVFCINKKQYVLVIILAILDILLFSIAMDKTYLLKLAISFGIGFIFPKLYFKFYTIVSSVILLGFLSSLIEHIILGTHFLFFLVIRRMFYVPSWMNIIYFDFFSTSPKLFLSQGVFVLSKFFPSVYDINYLALINNQYFYGTMPSPNTGFFAEAYSQLGVFGIIIFPLLNCVFFLFIDSVLGTCSSSCKAICSFCLASSITNIFIFSGISASIWIVFIPFAILTNSVNNYGNRISMERILCNQ